MNSDGLTTGLITLHSGIHVRLSELRVEDVNIEDLVHATSQLCRYTGHCRLYYSVAEHSVLACELAEKEWGIGSLVAKCALVHDLHEGYVGDVSSVAKQCVPEFKVFETQIQEVFLRAVNLPPLSHAVWQQVKRYDWMALHLEAKVLFSTVPPWAEPADLQLPILCLTPNKARAWLRNKLRSYDLL